MRCVCGEKGVDKGGHDKGLCKREVKAEVLCFGICRFEVVYAVEEGVFEGFVNLCRVMSA